MPSTSTVGLVVAALMVAAIIVRLLDEERFMREHFPAFADYQQRTRFRLIPRVW